MSKPNTSYLPIAIAVGIGVFLLIGDRVLSCASEYGCRDFDSQQWLAAHPRNDMSNESLEETVVVRRRMTNDILEHFLKEGMTRSEIDTALGSPDRDYIRGRDVNYRIDSLTSRAYVYYLGQYADENRFLDVIFGNDGRVSSFRAFGD